MFRSITPTRNRVMLFGPWVAITDEVIVGFPSADKGGAPDVHYLWTNAGLVTVGIGRFNGLAATRRQYA